VRCLMRQPFRANQSQKQHERMEFIPAKCLSWRRAMDDATEESLKSNERLVPESELKKAQARIKELERVLGRKTMDVEILEEAVRIGREKK